MLLHELSTLGTVPRIGEVVRIVNAHAAVVKPLVLALRVLALHHVLVFGVAADAVLYGLSGLSRRCILGLLLLRSVRDPTPRVVVICAFFILRVLQMRAEGLQ